MRHFGVPSAFVTLPGEHRRRERRVPEHLLRNTALRGHRASLAEGHARRFRRRVFLEPVDVLGRRIHCCRAVGAAAARYRRTHRMTAVGRHANAPFVDGHAVRNALVGCARHREPCVREAPAERWVLLAVIHMAVNFLSVDVLHIVREELGDVFVRGPVDRHAEIVAILRLELVLQILACEPVRAEPVEIRELLVGKLIELLVGRGGKARADEVFQVEPGVRVFLALPAM